MMNKSLLVSVITPFYNDIKYFPEALESYFSQSYPNIEMVLIDDNSNLLPDALIPANPRYLVRIIRSDKRMGPGGARNLGIRQARGELIAFLDSDDIWKPEFIQRCVEVFLKDEGVAWVYADGYYLIDNKPVRKPNSNYSGFKKGLPEGREVNEYHLKGYAFELMSANLMRRSVIEEVGFFNEELEVSEDWDLFCRIAEKYDVCAVNEPLIYYRKRSDGFHYSKLEDYIKVHCAILKQIYDRQGLLPERNDDLRRAIALSYEGVAIQYLNKGCPQRARYYLMHNATRPIRFSLRIMVLRGLSFLPTFLYKAAVKIYELII